MSGLLARIKKYAEIVAFGVGFGASAYMCSMGDLTRCVSALAVVKSIVLPAM